MMPEMLPYLYFFRATLTQLSAMAASEPAATMQAAAASRLLDYMIEFSIAAPTLEKQCYDSVQALLPAIESVIGNSDAATHELSALCTAADPGSFGRFTRRLADVQRDMLEASGPAAAALCNSVCGVEAAYHRDFETAVLARSASAERKTASTARNARAYDESALAEFIRRTFPGEAGVGIAQSGFISGGYSKFTIGITLSNPGSLPAEIIVRADAGATFGGASVVEEYRLLKILHEKGVRVPKPLAVEESGTVFGSPFMLVERKPGISIGHMYNLPQRNAAVCRDVAEQLAAIHRIPTAAFGEEVDNANGRSSDKAVAWIDEAVAAWRPLDMPSPAFETAFDWLRRNASLNDEAPRTLVHGDVHLANMLVHEQKVSAILDWEFAHIGNPAYDLGYFYDQAASLDSWQAFLHTYAEASGWIPDEDQLNYHILLAATRLGVMTCQSKAEFVSGEKPALPGAVVIGSFFYENTIIRISRALDRVLS